MTSDPYAPHLRQAEAFFGQGEIVKAGQIWQAILKQQPTHAKAREGLLAVKHRLLAQRGAEAAAARALPEPLPVAPVESAAVPEPAPPEQPPVPVVDPGAVAVPEPHPAPTPEPLPPAPPVPAEDLGRAPWTQTIPEPEPALAPPPVPTHFIIPTLEGPRPPLIAASSQDPDRLVTEGCTLYDMGQIEDGLSKWEQALAMDPSNALARSYANGARRELGLSVVTAEAEAVPVPTEAYPADEDADKLLREAVQLYDMGLVEEAIPKWERVLVLEPHRHEVEGYLKMARNELGQEQGQAHTPASTAPAAATLDVEALDLKLRQADHLLSLQRHEEAAFTFQQALRLSPGDARALRGLERCRKTSTPPKEPLVALHTFTPVMALDTQGRIAMANQETHPFPATDNQGIQPPAALLKAAPAPRAGLSLPDRLRRATGRMPWLKEPRLLAILGGCLLLLLLGFTFLHRYRRDQALKEGVRAAREAAVAPLGQLSQAPDLGETPESMREEAEASLVTDPLRAFLRAEALVNLNPKDAASAQLLEKTRAALPGGVSGASLPEFQKHLQNGDLEAAHKVIDALLRARPSNTDLRTRSARLQLTLCTAHAGQAKWEEAREDLLRGRALFPGDNTWQIRLRLLEHVKTLPKDQRGLWIALLG